MFVSNITQITDGLLLHNHFAATVPKPGIPVGMCKSELYLVDASHMSSIPLIGTVTVLAMLSLRLKRP